MRSGGNGKNRKNNKRWGVAYLISERRMLRKQLRFENCMSLRRLLQELPFLHCTFSFAFLSTPSHPTPSEGTYFRMAPCAIL